MDLVEQRIRRTLLNEITEPANYEYMIRNTINREFSKNTKKERIFRSIATVCASLLIITSVVFAEDIKNLIQQWFFASEGVNEAIEHGYIDEPQIGYIESEDAKVTVTNFVMDDLNMNLAFNVQLNKPINNYEGISKIEFRNINITDEENNIIFKQRDNVDFNEETLPEADIKYKEIENLLNYSIYVNSITQSNITFEMNITSKKLLNTNKIKIYLEDMILIGESNKETINLKGIWNLELDMPDKFSNRENNEYIVEECNNEYLNIDSVEVTVHDTGMKLYMEMEVYDGIQERINEYRGNGNIEDYLSIKSNAYVENENGEKFYISSRSDENGGYQIKDGIFIYGQTFNITKYNLTPKLKVVLETGRGELIIINLKK